MDTSVRNFRTLNRLFRRPISCVFSRNITGTAAVKEEANTELLHSFNNDIKKGGVVPVFRRALLFPTRVALQDEVGIYTYTGLYQASAALSMEISAKLLGDTGRTIAYMCGNDASHVIVQWAIWMSGNIAVPLTPLHPPDMLTYFVNDSESSLVVCTPDYEQTLRPIATKVGKELIVATRDKEITAQLYQPNTSFLNRDGIDDVGRTNMWYGQNDAMIIYTSGTTSKPKGVVWTHAMLSTQIAALQTAWRYSAGDVVLHALPLHHIHGQLNSLNASLASGARIRMQPSFAPHSVWARLLGMGEREDAKVTVFHGVPSMYAKLAGDHEQMFAAAKTEQYVRATLGKMRLMVSGSAPLPESLARKWYEISGHWLLERYGMTEAGMALSNAYRSADAGDTTGSVGRPLPSVSARIVSGDDVLVTVETPGIDAQISLRKLGLNVAEESSQSDNTEWQPSKVTRHTKQEEEVYSGELQLKGPGVFTRYWGRPVTLESKDFTSDGWFRTGDTASFSNNKFKILGRTSVDIIKSGGYKVSALQVESAILEHPNVTDAAVLGIDDDVYGEIVSAVVTLKPKTALTLKELKDETGKRLAPYQLPKSLVVVDKMPRNTMGKLDKKEIRKLYAKDLKLKKK